VAAPATQQDVESTKVEPLDAAILTRHQGVVLVAESGIDRELLVHLPAIRDVDRVLVLASAQLFVLNAFGETAHLPEQEPRISIPSADAGVARSTGHATAERQNASRIADFGLPMIQPEPDEIEARAQFVPARALGQVGRFRVAAL